MDRIESHEETALLAPPWQINFTMEDLNFWPLLHTQKKQKTDMSNLKTKKAVERNRNHSKFRARECLFSNS